MKHFPKSDIIEALCGRKQPSAECTNKISVQPKISKCDKIKNFLCKMNDMIKPLKDIFSAMTSLCCAIMVFKNVF